jgi:crotonobetainyl-CoA:carnitine CoA-transferase CaiB-like acyl-CoA transferase
MTVVWSGPYVTQILGDLGADVIRVDNPWIFPTVTRGLLPRPPAEIIKDVGGIFGGYPDADPGKRPWNRVGLFNAHARNKRSITIDLRKDLGRKAFFKLVQKCDVMIENNSVDLLDHLGIGWEEIRAVNPRLILVRMPAVGLEGPYRDYLGFGVNFEALCGLGSIRGYGDSDLSENDGVYHMDAASGSAGVLATLLALRKRDKTGVGEIIELSQCENMLNHIGEFLIDAARTGNQHEPIGNRHRVHAPQGCYQCEGADKWIALSITTDKQWQSLCALMETSDLANDKELESVEGRQKRHDELDERIGAWVETREAADLFHKLQSYGIPAAPVLNELEALADSHLRARGMFAPNGNLDTGTHDYPTHVWRWDGPDMAYGPLPVLGGSNKDIYQNLLGMTEDEYLAMELDGHISEDYLMPDGSAQ